MHEESKVPIHLFWQPTPSNPCHRRPKDSLKPAQKLKRHEPHHSAQIPHRTSQPNRINASGSQVSILLSSFPVCGCQSASGCFQRSKWSFALLHSFSDDLQQFHHFYWASIYTNIDGYLLLCWPFPQLEGSSRARRVSKIKARSITRWRSHIVCGGKPFLKIPYDASSENSVIYTRRRFTYEWCLL